MDTVTCLRQETALLTTIRPEIAKGRNEPNTALEILQSVDPDAISDTEFDPRCANGRVLIHAAPSDMVGQKPTTSGYGEASHVICGVLS